MIEKNLLKKENLTINGSNAAMWVSDNWKNEQF